MVNYSIHSLACVPAWCEYLKTLNKFFKRFSLGVYTVLLQFDISVNTILHNFGIQIH